MLKGGGGRGRGGGDRGGRGGGGRGGGFGGRGGSFGGRGGGGYGGGGYGRKIFVTLLISVNISLREKYSVHTSYFPPKIA